MIMMKAKIMDKEKRKMVRYFEDFGKRVYVWWLNDWGNVVEECDEDSTKWYVIFGDGSEILVDKKDCENDKKLIRKEGTRVYDGNLNEFGTIKILVKDDGRPVLAMIKFDFTSGHVIYYKDTTLLHFEREKVYRVSKAFEKWYDENKDLFAKKDFTSLEKTLLDNTDEKFKYLFRSLGGALFLSDAYIDDPMKALLSNTTSFRAYDHLFQNVEENTCVKFRN